MTNDDFERRRSELLDHKDWQRFLGIESVAQYHTKAGLSSLFSEVAWLEEMDQSELRDVPDFILSDALQKSLESAIWICLIGLRETKYMPSSVDIGSRHGALPEGARQGVYVEGWEDFEIPGSQGQPVYTTEAIDSAVQQGEQAFGAAMWFIVKDICDSGDFLSQDWYRARIVYEYFRDYPLPPENAFLIGELFKELCTKEEYEGDLRKYYLGLSETAAKRRKGTATVKQKAQELRDYCVQLFAELAASNGIRLMMAPPEVQAAELKAVALEKRPEDFVRAGKPYSKEWFLRNIIEDRKLEIVEAVENMKRE